MSTRGRPRKNPVEEKPAKVAKAEKPVKEKPAKPAKTAKPKAEKLEKPVKEKAAPRTRKTKDAKVEPKAEIPKLEPKAEKPELKAAPPSPPPQITLPPRANPLLAQTQAQAQAQAHRRAMHGLSPRILTVMGVGLLSISTYCGYLYTSYRREAARAAELNVPADVSDRYNTTASTFDADVATSETLMRLGRKRADLVQQARGNVLEVSCGTGRNLGYYNFDSAAAAAAAATTGGGGGGGGEKGCRTVSFVDLSPQMVEVTRQKAREILDSKVLQRVAFRACDAGEVSTSVMPGLGASGEGRGRGWMTMKPRYFDTVVQTMGLCSMPDPVGTLRHLGTITEPREGRILLLEHGRSYYEWLNRVLDGLAPAHANRHGCWWNRDIGEIVRASGLEVVEVKRWHLGTTWRVILRPS